MQLEGGDYRPSPQVKQSGNEPFVESLSLKLSHKYFVCEFFMHVVAPSGTTLPGLEAQ